MRLTNDPSRPRLHPELSVAAELERLDQRRRPLCSLRVDQHRCERSGR